MDQPNGDTAAGDLARATITAMFDRDRASRALGMAVEATGPGHARLRMTVRDDMIQGYGTCHGGMLFALADSAFAFACNSRNQSTVAAGCQIEFLQPANAGDVLVAEAQERTLQGRNGIYDVTITNDNGDIVALFRGKSRAVAGQVIAET